MDSKNKEQHQRNTKAAFEIIAQKWYPELDGEIVLSVTDAGRGELVLASVPGDDDFWIDLFTAQVGWRLDTTITDIFRIRFSTDLAGLCQIINVTDGMLKVIEERRKHETSN
ncbi:MAG: hypothetical protein WAV40_04315 [Microgenomates group bacterium]